MDRASFLASAEAWLSRSRHDLTLLFPLVGVLIFALLRWLSGAEGEGGVLGGWAPAVTMAADWLFPILMLFGVVAMALPLVIGLLPLLDGRALAGLVVLALFAYLIEGLGVLTGLPYGHFAYLQTLEPMLFDLVPLSLPLLWLPIVLSGYVLAVHWARGRGRFAVFALATGLIVLQDLILDPGAVALGFWAWDEPGGYYGVPGINFAGWVLSSAVAVAVLLLSMPPARLRDRAARFRPFFDTLVAFLLFWGAVNALLGQWIPLLLAAAFGGTVHRLERSRYHPFRDAPVLAGDALDRETR